MRPADLGLKTILVSMRQLCASITGSCEMLETRQCCLQPDSRFAQAYAQGTPKKDYWDPVYEDSMNLIAKLPGIAALIYRNTYFGGNKIPHNSSLDWAANLAHQMGESTRTFGHAACSLLLRAVRSCDWACQLPQSLVRIGLSLFCRMSP